MVARAHVGYVVCRASMLGMSYVAHPCWVCRAQDHALARIARRQWSPRVANSLARPRFSRTVRGWTNTLGDMPRMGVLRRIPAAGEHEESWIRRRGCGIALYIAFVCVLCSPSAGLPLGDFARDGGSVATPLFVMSYRVDAADDPGTPAASPAARLLPPPLRRSCLPRCAEACVCMHKIVRARRRWGRAWEGMTRTLSAEDRCHRAARSQGACRQWVRCYSNARARCLVSSQCLLVGLRTSHQGASASPSLHNLTLSTEA